MRGSHIARIAGLTAGLAIPAAAIVYVVPPDGELIDRSPLIVYGKIVDVRSAQTGGKLMTDSSIRVERVLKGWTPGSVIVVRQKGGVASDRSRREVVMGLPTLVEGEQVLLFLVPGREGVYRTVDMGLGMFFEDRNHLVRHDVADDGFRHAQRFSQWIEDREAGLARPADYHVKEFPGPRRVTRQANLIDPECKVLDPDLPSGPMRWPNWDPGYTPVVTEGGDLVERPLAVNLKTHTWDNEPLALLNSAIGAWNGSGSSISLPAATVGRESEQRRRLHYDVWSNWISVELGGDHGCSYLVEERLFDKNVNKPLFVDTVSTDDGDVGVAFYEEGGETTYSGTGTYICSGVEWDGGSNAGTPGASDACSDNTDSNGHYTVQSSAPRAATDVVCGLSNVMGSVQVEYVCGDSERSSTAGDGWHSIPGGGHAYRITNANIVISDGTVRGHNMRDATVLTSVLAHELGHALGLDHSDSSVNALMNASYTGLTSLQADDVAGARALYPVPTGGSVGGSPPSSGGGGGGGALPSESEPEPPPPPPPPVPPVASFTVDMPCEDGLCRALTGGAVAFTDTSSGTVARRSWDFESTGRTPSGKSVSHDWPSPGFYRATLTVEGAGVESTASRMFRVDAADPAGSCEPGPETACLQDSRYEVEVEWQHPDGALHTARVVHAGTNDSGLFSFFDGDNWEMLVKVLNGCSINGRHWVYAASATSLPFELSITDTETGEVYRYSKGPDELAALADPAAFANSCEIAD